MNSPINNSDPTGCWVALIGVSCVAACIWGVSGMLALIFDGKGNVGIVACRNYRVYGKDRCLLRFLLKSIGEGEMINYEFDIELPIDSQSCFYILKDFIDEKKQCLGIFTNYNMSGKRWVGKVEPNNFEIYKIRKVNNFFNPKISGTVLSGNSTVTVHCKITISKLGKFLLSIWSTILCVVGFILAFTLFTETRLFESIVTLILMSAMLFCIWYGVYYDILHCKNFFCNDIAKRMKQ